MNAAILPVQDRSGLVTITRIYVVAILCVIAWFAFTAIRNRPDHRDTANDRTAEMCVAWSGESSADRYLAGPEIRDQCTRYLSHRTPKDMRMDADYANAQMQNARQHWAAYAASHKPVAPQP